MPKTIAAFRYFDVDPNLPDLVTPDQIKDDVDALAVRILGAPQFGVKTLERAEYGVFVDTLTGDHVAWLAT